MQTLCVGREEREAMEGKRILVVDDVISTGESLTAIDKLVNAVGGNIWPSKMAVLRRAMQPTDDIIFREVTSVR